MLKKFIVLSLSVIMICGLVACGKSSQKSDETEKTPTKTSDKTIKTDIIEFVEGIDFKEDFAHTFVNESKYQFIESNIVKRQVNSDEKEDIIYLNITVQNDYFEVDFNQTMTYFYYDEGGWILENCSFEEITDITLIAAADQDLILQEWWDCGRSYANLTEYKRENQTNFESSFNELISIKILDCKFDKKNMSMKLYIEVTSSLSTSKGYIPLKFDKENGWQYDEITGYEVDELTFAVTELECGDYSKAKGVFEEMASPILKTRFTVHNINMSNGTRTLSIDYIFVTGVMNDYTESNIVIAFDPISGSGYNPEINSWDAADRIS